MWLITRETNGATSWPRSEKLTVAIGRSLCLLFVSLDNLFGFFVFGAAFGGSIQHLVRRDVLIQRDGFLLIALPGVTLGVEPYLFLVGQVGCIDLVVGQGAAFRQLGLQLIKILGHYAISSIGSGR